jgi:2',3'-cyclic-nucleotide 2'-phosphodiesterase (5'-nucleotidase family)
MSKFRFIWLLAVLHLVVFSSAFAGQEVVILHTNDTHARLVPFSHKTHGPDCGGIARRAGLVKMIRQTSPHALLLDAGDIFQGTPFYSIFKGEACYIAAAACGYDATTMGNHELDNSLGNLQTQIEASQIRFICCNVLHADTRKPVFKPYHIFVRNGVRIAVIGSIGNEAWESIDRKIRASLLGINQIDAVRDIARRIRRQVDLVVVLSHAGIDEDKKMAAAIAEIDVILGGHTHDELHEPLLIKNLPESSNWKNGLDGTIVAQAGEHGVFLGRIDLALDGQMKIASWTGKLLKIGPENESAADPELLELVASYSSGLDQIMQRKVGHTSIPLTLAKDQKKTHILPMGTFTATAMMQAGKADMCAVNSGAIRCGIETGDITCGEIYESLPYDNTVITFSMTGEAVQAMLDYICANHSNLDGFQFAGIAADFNLKSGKAENARIAGKNLDKKRIYRVATSSFVANGNLGGDVLFAKVEAIEDSGIFMRDAALNYLAQIHELPDYSVEAVRIIR